MLNQIQAVSQFLGVSFEGVERQAIDLFIALERELSVLGSDMNDRRLRRELKNLKFAFRSSSKQRVAFNRLCRSVMGF